jgi:hypothetical protein
MIRELTAPRCQRPAAESRGTSPNTLPKTQSQVGSYAPKARLLKGTSLQNFADNLLERRGY